MFEARSLFDPRFMEEDPALLWEKISPQYSVDESAWLKQLISLAQTGRDDRTAISGQTARLVGKVRARSDAVHTIDALLLEYSLDTREGILLMCLAEALMRVPDAETVDALIRDKLSVAEWKKHLRQSDSFLVNASSWGLMLTGKIVSPADVAEQTPGPVINRLLRKMGEPLIRKAVSQAMKIMGQHFILGRTIEEALKNSRTPKKAGYSYSFDMLGEAALTAEDAEKHLQAYLHAVKKAGSAQQHKKQPTSNEHRLRPGISIKLSALHPRYEAANEPRVLTELFDAVRTLIVQARALEVDITIDAEEQDRLELSLKLFEKLYRHPDCTGWGGFGLAVQAYGKRALPVLGWLAALARQQGDCIPVRLVKGAYWDTEIKLCQQAGYSGYPVYTRKEATDLAYLVCARFLLSPGVQGHLYPQFATHNAQAVTCVLTDATAEAEEQEEEQAEHKAFEFQRLYGMGDALYQTLQAEHEALNVRVYAPVGGHRELLPYLVRRLLENGANSSFVHRLVDARTPVAELVHHPLDRLEKQSFLANSRIPLPADIFGTARKNSRGLNLNIDSQWDPFYRAVQSHMQGTWQGGPVIDGKLTATETATEVRCPYDRSEAVGHVHYAGPQEVDQALAAAHRAWPAWSTTSASARARYLEDLADLLEANRAELVALCHKEAGKTLGDSIDEVREAVDFCRYYACQAREKFSQPLPLPGPTGESNELYLTGRGPFVCISPWNFPLAIFLGQVTAALAAGNTVVAKPAEQTSLIATRILAMMMQVGIPGGAVQLLTGEGRHLGRQLTADDRVAGIAFTGSTRTAQAIHQVLAARGGPIVPLIAETGGQNAMIVDSTALPEQVVPDVIQSAFASAGQRCSALRVLYLQEDVADHILKLLRGAIAELKVGDPSLRDTDLGPIISSPALARLKAHVTRMKNEARLVAEAPLDARCAQGHFLAPVAFEIDSIHQLKEEQFGPILHVIRYKASQLDRIIAEINSTGYGLTLGIHSRNETTAAYIEKHLRVGNTYVNRNQIGAVVGVQPFGGQGLSGTGPKAGGPHYLYRFATERTRTINTTASGGNAALLSLDSSI